MPRPPRYFVDNEPLHVVARGHCRNAVFIADDDRTQYLRYLHRSSRRFQVSIHAWVLMGNHIHLLLTPANADSLSGCMHWLSGMYSRYFNLKYDRSGSLWEGRYRTAHIDSAQYVLACYRYIELNPVRAAIVSSPAHYPWSSYHANALGKYSGLVTPHACYLGLGSTPVAIQENYRSLFGSFLQEDELRLIRQGATNKSPATPTP